MSRLTGTDAYGLMEAYQAVYAPQELTEEQVWEEVETWVNSLVEEGYDLSDYTWEEMYESYLSEDAQGTGAGVRRLFGQARRAYGDVVGAFGQGFAGKETTSKNPVARTNNALSRAASTPTRALGDFARGFVSGQGSAKPVPNPSLSNIPTTTKGPSPYNAKNLGADQFKDYKAGGGDAAMAKGSGTVAQIIARGRKASSGSGGGSDTDVSGAGRGDTGSGSTPTAPTGGRSKLAPTPTKPAAAAQTGDKTKDMATFAKANSILATAAAEKARIRGTQQTDNPLMKSMRSRLPMNSPSVQAPAVSNLGKGNQSLSQNPNAFKAAPPKPVATSTAPEVKATNTAAATPKPTPVAPKAPTGGPKTRAQVLGQSFDPFDVVMGHLLDEGYADTNESALVIMANMSEEWRQSIVEGGFNSSGRYDVGGGRTVGPVAGAVRSLFGGNLPKGQTYVPPSPQNGTNRPPAVPSSKGDSGKLTDFGAGGGKAKLKTGMSVGQVERQGRRNKGDYSG